MFTASTRRCQMDGHFDHFWFCYKQCITSYFTGEHERILSSREMNIIHKGKIYLLCICMLFRFGNVLCGTLFYLGIFYRGLNYNHFLNGHYISHKYFTDTQTSIIKSSFWVARLWKNPMVLLIIQLNNRKYIDGFLTFPVKGHGICWRQFQLSLGERQGTPWTGRQSVTG